jgi:RNA polymerase sigma-70 factor (ECF subfamily)
MQTAAVTPEVRDVFDRLYREHGDRLWRSLLLSTGRPEIASDATAEAFAQAIRRGDQIRDPLAWVWRAAFKIAAGELSSERRTVELVDEPVDPTLEPVADLLAALRRLTPHQRASITLHHYAGYSYREIARILGSSTSAVGVHIHRAKTLLRAALEDRDG